jgi:hypothetical protein
MSRSKASYCLFYVSLVLVSFLLYLMIGGAPMAQSQSPACPPTTNDGFSSGIVRRCMMDEARTYRGGLGTYTWLQPNNGSM